MKKKPKPSPVMQLLMLVWYETPRGSWPRLNGAMCDAMDLAIKAKFTFARDDFEHALEEFRGNYWFDTEGFYARACHADNLSAAQSFEAWQRRPPFIVDDVGGRKRGRVAVGSSFRWRGELVTVTSFPFFPDGTDHFIACSYRGSKVKRIYTINVADIREERATTRERKRLMDRAQKLVNSGVCGFGNILKRHGVTTEADWSKAPIDTLRTVVKKLEAKEATD